MMSPGWRHNEVRAFLRAFRSNPPFLSAASAASSSTFLLFDDVGAGTGARGFRSDAIPRTPPLPHPCRRLRLRRLATSPLRSCGAAACKSGGIHVPRYRSITDETLAPGTAYAPAPPPAPVRRSPKSRLWRPATKPMSAKSAAGDFLPIEKKTPRRCAASFK